VLRRLLGQGYKLTSPGHPWENGIAESWVFWLGLSRAPLRAPQLDEVLQREEAPLLEAEGSLGGGLKIWSWSYYQVGGQKEGSGSEVGFLNSTGAVGFVEEGEG